MKEMRIARYSIIGVSCLATVGILLLVSWAAHRGEFVIDCNL